MQGKETELFNKKFIDNSWSELSALLDERMPVSEDVKSKNSGLIWFLSALLCISIGLAFFYAYKYKSIIPNANLTKERIVTKTIYQVQEIPAQHSNKGQANNTNNNLEQDLLIELSHGEMDMATQASIIDKNSSESIEDVLDVPLQAPLRKSLIDIRERENKYQLNRIENKNQESKKRVDFSVGMQATTSTDFDYSGVGIQSGLLFSIGRRFGINTGLGINFLSKNHYFLPHFLRDNPNNPKTNVNRYQDIRTMRQIFLPVGLNYSITPQLALNSGVKIRYTFSDEVDDNRNNRGRSPNQIPIENTFMDKTNLGLSAGISYSLTRNMSLLIDSEWGVNQLWNNTPFIKDGDPGLNYNLNLLNLTTNIRF